MDDTTHCPFQRDDTGMGNIHYAGQYDGGSQHCRFHPQPEQGEKKQLQPQVVYTTAGTRWDPDANKPLQPPIRRGRVSRYGLNAESAPFHPGNQLAYSAGDTPFASRPIPQYEPLRQNDDRALSPAHARACRDHILLPTAAPSMVTGRLPARFGGVGAQAETTFTDMAPGIIADGEVGVYDAADELISKLSVKSLANLASYPNPNQENARRVLRDGQRLQPTLSMEGTRVHTKVPIEAVVEPIPSAFRLSSPGFDQLARSTSQLDRWRVQEYAPDMVAPYPNRQAIQAFRFQQSQALGNGLSRIMPAGGYSSTTLATGPGAPEPLKAGPPGQRQQGPLKLGNPSLSSGTGDHSLLATGPETENQALPSNTAEQRNMQFRDDGESEIRRQVPNRSSKPDMEVMSLESDDGEGVYVSLSGVAPRPKAADAMTQGPLGLTLTRIASPLEFGSYEQDGGAGLLQATKAPDQDSATIQGAGTESQKYGTDTHADHAKLVEFQRTLEHRTQGIAAKEVETPCIADKMQDTDHEYLSSGSNKDIEQQHMEDAEYAGIQGDGCKHSNPMSIAKLLGKLEWEATEPHGWDPSQYSIPYFGTYPYGAMRMSEEQLRERQEKVDGCFYSNTSRLGTSIADTLAEREQGFHQGLHKHPEACPFGAIGEGRLMSNFKPSHHDNNLVLKPKQTYEHMGVEEANALPVAQHAKPLLNLAFQAILHHKDAEATKEQPKYKRAMKDEEPYGKSGSAVLLRDSLPDAGWV